MKHKKEKTYRCTICPRSFTIASHLDIHMKAHEREDQRAKALGLKQLKRLKRKNGQIKVETEVDLQRHKCPECSDVFWSRSGLVRHSVSRHGAVGKHNCDICSKMFMSPSALKNHKEGVHEKKKTYRCELCGIILNSSASMKNHMHHHQNLRHHKCQICGKGFNVRQNLKSHMDSHNVGRTVPCDICGNLFKSRRSMEGHRRYAHLNTTFPCENCGKHFKNKVARDRHQRLHVIWDAMPKRPSMEEIAAMEKIDLSKSDFRTCPFCQKEFKAKHTFKGHVKLCGKCCSLCHKRFEHPHIFRKHALKNHEVADWESLIYPPPTMSQV